MSQAIHRVVAKSDHKKVDLVAWATSNLGAFPLIATRHPARLVRDKVGLEVEERLSDPDIRALLRVCNTHNVPVATNLATADVIIAGLRAAPAPPFPPASPRADPRLSRAGQTCSLGARRVLVI